MAALPYPGILLVPLLPHSTIRASGVGVPPASPSNTSSKHGVRQQQPPGPQLKIKASTRCFPRKGMVIAAKTSGDHPGPHHSIFHPLQPRTPHVTPCLLQATLHVTPPCRPPFLLPQASGAMPEGPCSVAQGARRGRWGDAALPSATCSRFHVRPARPPLPHFKN